MNGRRKRQSNAAESPAQAACITQFPALYSAVEYPFQVHNFTLGSLGTDQIINNPKNTSNFQ